ncbi:annexin A1 [Ictalurus punctatus]|uniref:Annexin n=1 Tax=Ictalurus punctatus TaxID=7998 RepID=W5U629_ICTPU|nr:annexin A1 [Ictalurus punctatus]XP_017315417.1 annexin A1 [Ictalurus punctatus]XP_017315418.1 annexin A1 [Ictalurus punctatus]
MSFFHKLFKGLTDDKPKDNSGKDSSKGSATPYYGTVRPDPNFNASRDGAALKEAIETKGVDENAITEILARRTNAQRQEIKAAFQQDSGKDLVKTLNSVLKSHYKNVALALLMTPAQYDAHELKQALKGLGTKEKVLNEILGTRSNQEIQLLKTAYKDAYGKELEHDIRGDTSGHYQTALLALSKGIRKEDRDIDDGLAKSEAKALFEAGEKRLGTVSSVFIDVLTSRGDAQLCKIFKAYDKFGTEGFAQAVKQELSGDTEDCLMTLVKAAWNKPAYFAERMHLAMKGMLDDHDTMIRIIVSRSEVDLQKIIQEYKRMYGKVLQQDVLAETKGDYQKILLVLCGDQTGV